MVTPTKKNDEISAQVALSAVEQALNLDGVDSETKNQFAQKSQDPSADMRREPSLGAAAHPGRRLSPPTSAANDTTSNAAAVASALYRQSSGSPYLIAILIASAWVGGIFVLTPAIFGIDVFSLLTRDGLRDNPGAIALLGTLLFPPLLFIAIGHFMARAQQLRAASRAMAEVALHLATPLTKSQEGMLTLGQSVRRELALLDEGMAQASGRVDAMTASITREIATLDRAYRDNETRMRDMLETIKAQKESLEQKSQIAVEQISALHASFAEQLRRSSLNLTNTVNELGTRTADMLASRGQTIADTLHNAGATMVDAFTARGDSLVSKLSDAGQAVTLALNISSDDLAANIASRSEEVTSRLSLQMRAIAEALAQDLATRGNEVAERIDSVGKRIDQTVTVHGGALAERLDNTEMKIRDIIATHGDKLVSSLEARGEVIEGILTKTLATIEGTSGVAASAIASQVETLLSHIDDRAEHLARGIDERMDNLNVGLDGRLFSFKEALDQRAAAIDQTMGTVGATIDQALLGRLENLTDLMQRHTTAISEEVTSGTELLGRSIADHLSAIAASLDDRAASIADILESRASSIDLKLGEKATSIAETLETNAGRIEQALGAMRANLDTNGAGITLALDEAARNLSSQIGETTHRAIDTLTQSAARIQVDYDAGQSRFTDQVARIEEALGDMREKVAASGHTIISALDASALALNLELTGTTKRAVDALSEAGRRIHDEIFASQTELADKTDRVELALADMRSNLEANGHTVINALDAAGHAISMQLSGTTDRTIAALTQAGQRLHADLSASQADIVTAILTNLDTRGQEIVASISQTAHGMTSNLLETSASVTANLQQISGAVQATLEQAGSALTSDIMETGGTITATIRDNGATVAKAFEEKATMLAQLVTLQGAVLKQTLADGATTIGTTITGDAKKAVEQLSTTYGTIGTDTRKVVLSLSDTTRQLGDVLHSADVRLGALDIALGTRVDNVMHTLDQVTGRADNATAQLTVQTDALQTAADAVDNNGRRLLHDIGGQAANLTRVAQSLQDANSAVEAALGARRAEMETLSEQITRRAESVDEMLRERQQNIQRTLEMVQDRTREIGQFLAQASQLATQAAIDQFERLRNDAGSESERSQLAVREAFDQVSAEISGALTQATERFATTAQELQSTAATIRSEIDATRHEMRKSVLELPRETQESTAAMRRVVADQIRALNELSDIVARHGSASDVSQPARRPAARIEPASAAPARAADFSMASEPAPRRLTPIKPVVRPRGEEPRGEAAPTGWLRDLLTRASREDDERSSAGSALPRSASTLPDSLGQLSSGIADAIDSDALLEAWDRYRRGERKVFTRHLYSLQGQQSFDDIRRKYSRDNEFRAAVDRYIDDFERLIRDISRRDPDNSQTQTYLVSETGKVYTLLAHASGRLE